MIMLRLQFADTKYKFTKKCNQADTNDLMKATGLSETMVFWPVSWDQKT